MVLAFYVSGHGLGHASRDLEVIRAILQRRPQTRIVVRTSAARWFFDSEAAGTIEVQPVEVDTGVVQIDSLRLDEDETARRAAVFYATLDDRANTEARFLSEVGATVVVGDVPPLAFAAARAAALPSIALGNFTWDWIYSAYPQFERLAPGVLARIRDAYGHATRALRLPMHGGFEPMVRATTDIPLIARHAHRSKADTRRALGIGDDAIVVLASFGGYGLRLPYDEIARALSFTLVVTERELKGAGQKNVRSERGRPSQYAVVAREVAYPDLVAAADVVVSKPGYGIVSECIANEAALLYTARGRFVEHDVMVAEMPRLLRCRFIPQEDLLAGRWAGAIEGLLAQAVPQKPATDGAGIAADYIIKLCDGSA